MGASSVKSAAEDDFLVESNGSVAGTLFEARYGGDPPTRLVAQTERFAVLADLAPLCEGHVLVVPRTYYPSFAALPANWWPDLEQLLARLDGAMLDAFGPTMVLEHGSSSQLQHSPCVSHAHLHLVPVAADLAPGLLHRWPAPVSVTSLRELGEAIAPDCAYVCCGAVQGPIQVVEAESGDGVPRQYLRRALAGALGSEEWDWGVPAAPELLRTTVKELSDRLGADPAHATRG